MLRVHGAGVGAGAGTFIPEPQGHFTRSGSRSRGRDCSQEQEPDPRSQSRLKCVRLRIPSSCNKLVSNFHIMETEIIGQKCTFTVKVVSLPSSLRLDGRDWRWSLIIDQRHKFSSRIAAGRPGYTCRPDWVYQWIVSKSPAVSAASHCDIHSSGPWCETETARTFSAQPRPSDHAVHTTWPPDTVKPGQSVDKVQPSDNWRLRCGQPAFDERGKWQLVESLIIFTEEWGHLQHHTWLRLTPMVYLKFWSYKSHCKFRRLKF